MELKDILEYVGFDADKVKTFDEFKAQFDKSFVKGTALSEDHEFVKPILGKFFNMQENELKKLAKVYEIELDNDEFKGLKKVSEKVDYVLKKKAELSSAKIKELEEKVNLGGDQKLAEAMENHKKLEAKYNDTKGLLDGVKKEYESFKTESANQMKGIKLSTHKEEAMKKVKFLPTISELQREGYQSIVNKKYKFDLDETGNFFVTDSEGKRIPNPKKAGEFKLPEEVLTEEATAAGLIQQNKDGGKPATVFTPQSQTQTQVQPANERRVAARLE